MLNKLFEDEVHKVVGDDAYVTLKKTEAYRSALRDFDSTIKLAFRGKTDTDKYVSFPLAKLQDNKPMGLERDSLTLSGGTLFRIFDPIIREIDKLVTEQVTSVRMERLQLGNTAGASVKVGLHKSYLWFRCHEIYKPLYRQFSSLVALGQVLI